MQMITGIIRIILYKEEKSWGWIKINEVMQDYVKNQEISGAALLVRRGDEILYENRWGYSRCETNQEIKEDRHISTDVYDKVHYCCGCYDLYRKRIVGTRCSIIKIYSGICRNAGYGGSTV